MVHDSPPARKRGLPTFRLGGTDQLDDLVRWLENHRSYDGIEIVCNDPVVVLCVDRHRRPRKKVVIDAGLPDDFVVRAVSTIGDCSAGASR